MSYASLMVHLELGRSNAPLLKIVAELAERFHAGVVGIAACPPLPMLYGESYFSGESFEQDRARIEKDGRAAEAEFRSLLQTRVTTLDWRSTAAFASPTEYLVREARSADLVITSAATGPLLDPARHVNISDLIMQLGRPVLIVPATTEQLKLERVILGWKDTREARRVALDALPLMKAAGRVSVVEIAAKTELAAARSRVEDVAAWLKQHSIIAEPIASLATDDEVIQLNSLAQQQGADVIVAGAYGHSRLREWALGGVTRDLLLSGHRCTLLSH